MDSETAVPEIKANFETLVDHHYHEPKTWSGSTESNREAADLGLRQAAGGK